MFSKKTPEVSICIPVCGTENVLFSCLESIALNFNENTSFSAEIVIVDDSGNSQKTDKFASKDFQSVRKIIKTFKKEHKKQKIGIKLIEHEKNKGIIEARRTAVYAAEGDYIIFVDSDDSLPSDAIKTLFDTAKETSADIVQGKANICVKGRCGEFSPQMGVSAQQSAPQGEGFPPQIKKRAEETDEKANHFFAGELFNRQIFDEFLLKKNIPGYLWGKIFTRKLCICAFENIPIVFCSFGEDLLLFFFLSFFAQKYVGIEKISYNYNIDTGISSFRTIASLEEWKKICSTASVFTILLSWIEENKDKLTTEEVETVKKSTRWYAANNLAQLKKTVAPELQKDALKMLCDFWGEDMINNLQ